MKDAPMPLAPEKLNELHESIHADIRALAAPAPDAPDHPLAAAPAMAAGLPATILGLSLPAIAGQLVPVLTDVALKMVGPAVEDFAEAHAVWVRKYVGPTALAFAARLIKDLESAPAPPPA
jgi:hypothetical protein